MQVHWPILARRVAEAQIDLQRVRYARQQFLSDRLANPNYYSLARVRKQFSLIRRLLGPHPPEIPSDVLSEDLDTAPLHGPRKFAAILSEEAERLRTIDRYERRALSRRKFAIRALDLARSPVDHR